MAKQINIDELKPGMFILGIIEQNGPVKIKKTGLVSSAEMVQGLAEMGVVSVAIDPEKTVEIAGEDAHHVSQTQFVMQANEESPRQDADNQLTEQFNRSLFMPSLQQVPSAWQYYGVRTAIALAVILTGFTTGWLASYVPTVLSDTGQQMVSNSTIEPQTAEALPQLVEEGSQKQPQQDTLTQPDSVPLETDVAAVLSQSEPTDIEPLAKQASDASAQTQNTLTEVDNQSIETTSATEQAPAPVVSPELMQRFEAAMADLERESAPAEAQNSADLEYDSAVSDFNSTDVQRVDQLPARVMTRLPSMSFSAHMYASNPRDRWVKLNGIEMGEGEWLDDKLFLERIEPQHVILVFEGHQFSMRALAEW